MDISNEENIEIEIESLVDITKRKKKVYTASIYSCDNTSQYLTVTQLGL